MRAECFSIDLFSDRFSFPFCFSASLAKLALVQSACSYAFTFMFPLHHTLHASCFLKITLSAAATFMLVHDTL